MDGHYPNIDVQILYCFFWSSFTGCTKSKLICLWTIKRVAYRQERNKKLCHWVSKVMMFLAIKPCTSLGTFMFPESAFLFPFIVTFIYRKKVHAPHHKIKFFFAILTDGIWQCHRVYSRYSLCIIVDIVYWQALCKTTALVWELIFPSVIFRMRIFTFWNMRAETLKSMVKVHMLS